MKIGIKSVILFLVIISLELFNPIYAFPKNIIQDDILEHSPEFFALAWKEGTVLAKKETSMYIEVDSLGRQNINILVNKKQEPVLFTSNISTSVCADGECRLMKIQLYWTLLGGYAGFDPYPGFPLTKHEHDEFLNADYLKLHQLLLDNKSILKQRKIDELIDKPKQLDLNGVDGLSGATIAEVKETVVAGALYSCYVAWHLVHGVIKVKLKAYTLSKLNDEMVINMLYSNNLDYQMFCLNSIDELKYTEHHDRIMEIFDSGIPLVRAIIIKNFSENFWNTPELQEPIWNYFSTIDVNNRSLLLNHLDKATNEILEDLSSELKVMTKNQLKIYLINLENKISIDAPIIRNLRRFSEANKYTYAYLVQNFLEDRE